MRPSRCTLAKALTMTVLAGALVSGPARAQFYDPALRTLGLTTDVARSPRLIGMGGLSLVAPDHYQRLTLWDFAHNPVGIPEADSTSTLDLRPGSSSALSAYDQQPGLVQLQGGYREDLAGRATGMPFELVHRDGEGNAYGAVGTLASIDTDQPFSNDVEARQNVTHPEAMPFLAGPFPYFGGGKLHYALTLLFGKERVNKQYLGIVRNAGGDFLTLDGDLLTPPDYFEPLDYDVRTIGIGAAASYPLGRSNTFAIAVGQRGDRMNGSDETARSSSQINETRPTNTGQATLVGRLGKSIEYGVDGHAWSAKSQQNWEFSTSAGSGVVPLAGRGKLLERDARGTSLDARARWTAGAAQLDGQVWTSWSRVEITPPTWDDLTSFNRFLTQVFYRIGADTLMLPDSVVANRQEDHAVGFAGGASWAMHRGLVGIEYHWMRDAYDQTYGGAGPRQLGWDVRGGLEYTLTEMISGRLGGGYGWTDADTYTAQNEWTFRSASLGLGVHPRGTRWSFDSGYSLTWLQSDYGDPENHRGSRQHLETLVHWNF